MSTSLISLAGEIAGQFRVGNYVKAVDLLQELKANAIVRSTEEIVELADEGKILMKTCDVKALLKIATPAQLHDSIDRSTTTKELFAVLNTFRDMSESKQEVPKPAPKEEAKINIFLTRISTSKRDARSAAGWGVFRLTNESMKRCQDLVNSVPDDFSHGEKVLVATVPKTDLYRVGELFNRPGISWTWESA
jgi:hypothetical protein